MAANVGMSVASTPGEMFRHKQDYMDAGCGSDMLEAVAVSKLMSTKPHFSLLATSFAGGPRPRNTAIILFGLWFLLFFAALFAPPVLDDADGTHANAARAMATTGDIVTLKVDGVRYLEKAPLVYWLAAISFRIFGFNAFAAHLPQAITVLLLMLLGHRWANQAFGARTGYYTAVAVLSSAGVFLFTRVLIPDALLSLLLAASLFAFLRALGPIAVQSTAPNRAEIERPSIAWYAGPLFYPLVMWGSLAFAVLAKGLVALVFFFAAAFLFLALTGELGRWRKLKPVSGLLLFLAIAAPWHIFAAIRNPGGAQGGMGGHGFLWFYFVNEHVMRFLGRRIPADYNKLPAYLYWTLHLVWLFPWALFLPLGIAALWRRYRHQAEVLTAHVKNRSVLEFAWTAVLVVLVVTARTALKMTYAECIVLVCVLTPIGLVPMYRRRAALAASPFHRIDPQQRTILLLSIFSAVVLIFFSLSTNQEYYTFPAYLPILLPIAATITRAEQTFATDANARRWVTFAHAAFAMLGAAIALTLFYGLWTSRHLPYLADIGKVLAHRGVGSYTLSMSGLFDLTTEAFAALRMPALLAALAFSFGPALAWMLRAQRRHLAATTSIALTAAAFLFAAHIALERFGLMLSSKDFAEKITQLAVERRIAPETQIMLFGDQAYGSSIEFYLGRQVGLVNSRSSSMFFGSTFPDCPPVFLSGPQMMAGWGNGPRKIVFVPLEARAEFEALMGRYQIVIAETGGKALFTDRPLEAGR
jgi:4-amino-4-deoxy-L-arabinose transferase-like glycosyltransferase